MIKIDILEGKKYPKGVRWSLHQSSLLPRFTLLGNTDTENIYTHTHTQGVTSLSLFPHLCSSDLALFVSPCHVLNYF
jgi:hypothetical protein